MASSSCRAEIRNQIYEHALGGRKIHVYRGCFKRHICDCVEEHAVASQSTSTNEASCQVVCESLDETTARLEKHNRCRSSSDGFRAGLKAHISLNLLPVCRQIHSEAALTPFTSNSFEFTTDSHVGLVLTGFAASLTHKQVKAIAYLTLQIWIGPPMSSTTAPVAMLQPFLGLRRLTLHAECVHSFRGVRQSEKVRLQSRKKFAVGAPRLESVDMNIYITLRGVVFDQLQEVQDEAEDIRKVLLRLS